MANSESRWFCIDCSPVEYGPVLLFIGEVRR